MRLQSLISATVELTDPQCGPTWQVCRITFLRSHGAYDVAELTLLSRCAGESFVRKLISRVAARIAQESLGQEEREFTVGGRAAAVRPAYLLGQQAAALGVGSPFAGILPDLLLPPTAAEMMSYPSSTIQREGQW